MRTNRLDALVNIGKQQLEQSNAYRAKRHYTHLENSGCKIYGYPDKKLYIPSATGQRFHEDNTFIRCVMGPYGSGKSTMCVQDIVARATKMCYWDSGQRRSRWAIVRNTSGELQTTTLNTWLNWFSDLGEIRKRQKPVMTYEHEFNDGNGIVRLELLFIALDREDDIRKIKSLELTGVYINELSEVPENALAHFKGRVNKRYPPLDFCKEPYWSGIIADTNPPDIDHWIYRDFETKQLSNYKLFKQPPGLLKTDDNWVQNKKCDNYEHLAKDYYEKLAEGQTEDFIKVFCLGDYGIVGDGKRVYPEYNDDIHSVADIPTIQGEPLYLGFDFGLTPSCVVAQISSRGVLHILKEYTAEDMGIKTFVESIVLPGLQTDFPYCKVGKSVADPSGIKADEIMEELSCIGILNNLGIETHAARTNSLDPRISSVRYFLNRMVDGRPGFSLSRMGCPSLRKGFIRDYCYKRVAVAGEVRYRNEPHKTHPISDVADCLQYICMEFAATEIIKEKAAVEKVDMFNPIMRIF